MKDISKYITDSVISKLHEKGVTRQEIETKIEAAIQERTAMGYEGEELIRSVKLRVGGGYKNILRSNYILVKGIVFGMGRIEDANKKAMYLAKLKAGNTGYKPNLKYKVEEGHFPWGINQGVLIPEEPAFEQSGFIGIEQKGEIYLRSFKLTGDWVNNKTANNVVSGDIIEFKLDPKNIDKENIFISSYTIKSKLAETKYKNLLENELKTFNKSIREIVDENHSGFVILKGSVGDIEKLNNSAFRFDIVDDSVDWSDDYCMTTTMSEEKVTFIEGAMDILFIGDTYAKKNEPGFGINVYNTIVPEKFKKIELAKEVQEQIIENFEEEFEEKDSAKEEKLTKNLDELL